MILNIPDWCVIGKSIEVKMYDKNYDTYNWFKEKIISYSENGFYHQAHNCPIYHSLFSDYGKSVRECNEIVGISKDNTDIIVEQK